MRCLFPGGPKAVRAQRIALFVLLVLATAIKALAAPVPPSSATALEFEFTRSVSDSFWQAVVSNMERGDLSVLFGHPVIVVERKRVAEGTEFQDLVQVSLRGDCAAGLDFDSNGDGGALGWVYLLDGRIQRFVYVDCNQIARMLRSELRDKATGERQRVMARAISYVIVHELVHIATQDPGHKEAGLRKAHATKADLLSGIRELPRQGLIAVPKSAAGVPDEVSEASPFERIVW